MKAVILQNQQTTAQSRLSLDLLSLKSLKSLSTCRQLLNDIEKYEILYQFQFGFRKGRSTEQAIVEFTDNFKNAIDNSLFTCGVFLDFAKAFDTVNHNLLLKKMEIYGIRLPLQCFTNYLTNRQQHFSLAGMESCSVVLCNNRCTL